MSNLIIGPRGNHPAAILAGARAKVDDAVRVAHDLGVMLDDEYCIAQVAQAVQDLDQPVGIAAVKSNRGLV